MFLGYEWQDTPTAVDVDHALALLEPVMRPAGRPKILSALGTMRATTISRNADSESIALTFAAYAAVLARYPADCVLSAIEYWGENEKFWPSLAELKLVVEMRARRRLALRTLLERAKANG